MTVIHRGQTEAQSVVQAGYQFVRRVFAFTRGFLFLCNLLL